MVLDLFVFFGVFGMFLDLVEVEPSVGGDHGMSGVLRHGEHSHRSVKDTDIRGLNTTDTVLAQCSSLA